MYISATNVFETINRDILREKQALEYGTYVDYRTKYDATLPDNETTTSMYYLIRDGLLFKSYLPGYLRKRSTFCDQLVLPQACLLYTSPSPRDATLSRMPSSA